MFFRVIMLLPCAMAGEINENNRIAVKRIVNDMVTDFLLLEIPV
jgi:hypothetical protein